MIAQLGLGGHLDSSIRLSKIFDEFQQKLRNKFEEVRINDLGIDYSKK